MAGDVFQQTGHPLPHPPLQWLPKMTKKVQKCIGKGSFSGNKTRFLV